MTTKVGATAPPVREMSSLSVSNRKSTAKRDALRENEKSIQAIWEQERAFEVNHENPKNREKFLVTFPYPYSNGHLHIGHAFSLTKSVFRAQFERHRGKNVLFPFAFHCTGMPIQAAANKLKTEIEQFGCPPKFPEEDPEIRTKMEAEIEAEAQKKAAKANPDKKAKGGKTKLVSKTGSGIIRQWNILAKMVPAEEIPEFVDPVHWLGYFPPIGVEHMKKFGSGVDWRRAFITTSVNPYYDAFIRWQFNVLRAKKKILFGKRNNVYSLLDGQVCADHDRSEGEEVLPQEYVLIKLQVLPPEHSQSRHDKMTALMGRQSGKKVYLVPATLRPETMYGQTNCFVLPTGEYGAYYIDATDEIFIMSERSARGVSCQLYDTEKNQYFTKEFGKITCLETFTGDELLGLPLKAPNATYDKVYTLPLLTISMSKGTGVVTSVPSDAPDDYIALKALQDKPEFAAKYGITPDMVEPFKVVPIIEIPGYGEASAVYMCEKLEIKSFNDKAKLAQAKDETYLKGFNFGVMTIGPHMGTKVCDAKPLIKQEMIDSNQAHLYYEPESRVVSRTNDECVVAATDQWYLAYGEDSWREAVKNHVLDPNAFNAYDPNALSKYEYTVDWLKEWACTRQIGLGTHLPWDQQWVIESLSDSTIYMSYYTIAHILQGIDNLKGDATKSPGKVDPSDLTDDVFNYIYRNGPMPENCRINKEALDEMRSEFRYWYPMDLRTSAKDLIPNHLTMALYNHAAVWEDEPELWPRGYYTNGHVLVDAEKMSKSEVDEEKMSKSEVDAEKMSKSEVDAEKVSKSEVGAEKVSKSEVDAEKGSKSEVDAEKMSKSKGNTLMMEETVEQFTADGIRFACANAGDSLDDAYFSRETADAAILSLSNEETWIKETLASQGLRTGDADLNFMDQVLRNETNRLVRATEDCFAAMQFREGLQRGWFEMMIARNEYRSFCQDSGIPMHGDLLRHWAECLIVIICPVCPHWSENMWKQIGKDGLVVKAPWPYVDEEDKLLTRQAKFLRDALKNFRAQAGKAKKGWKDATILITDSYPQWKVDALLWMQEKYDEKTNSFSSYLMVQLKEWSAKNITDKKLIKFTMQFVSIMKKELEDVGAMALDIKLPFDQKAILVECGRCIKEQLNLEDLGIVNLETDDNLSVPDRISENVTPGRPYLWLR